MRSIKKYAVGRKKTLKLPMYSEVLQADIAGNEPGVVILEDNTYAGILVEHTFHSYHLGETRIDSDLPLDYVGMCKYENEYGMRYTWLVFKER